MEKIEYENFTVDFSPEKNTISFSGLMRDSQEYYNSLLSGRIQEFLNSIDDELLINLSSLEIINSAGIAFLCLLIVNAGKKGMSVVLQGSDKTLYHKKILTLLGDIRNEISISIV